MPKVTQAHLDARRQQILEAAQRCFARQGFHRTSMQDICEESGLSPGAVYRYFPGKAQIIAAVCAQSQEVNAALVQSLQSEGGSWLEALDGLVDYGFAFLSQPEAREHLRMTLQLWAEAVVTEEVNAALQTATISVWIQALTDLFRQAQQDGEISPDLDSRAMGGLMLAMWHGVALEAALNPGLDVSSYADAIKALYRNPLSVPNTD